MPKAPDVEQVRCFVNQEIWFVNQERWRRCRLLTPRSPNLSNKNMPYQEIGGYCLETS